MQNVTSAVYVGKHWILGVSQNSKGKYFAKVVIDEILERMELDLGSEQVFYRHRDRSQIVRGQKYLVPMKYHISGKITSELIKSLQQ